MKRADVDSARDGTAPGSGRSPIRLETVSPLLKEALHRYEIAGGGLPGGGPESWPALPEVRVCLETFEGPLRRRRTRIREGGLCEGVWRRGERSLWVLEGQGPREARALLHGGRLETAQAALKQFLRGFLPEWFLCHGGLVLHGATLVHRRQAFVFLAPSGGGKTTLARSHGQEGCLGDDAAFLWQDRDTGRWWALPSPLPGREPVPVTAPPTPLGGLFRLRKSPATTGRCGSELERHQALREVLARVRVDVRLASVRALLLDRALGLVQAQAVRVLHLPLHQSPWPILDAALGLPAAGNAP